MTPSERARVAELVENAHREGFVNAAPLGETLEGITEQRWNQNYQGSDAKRALDALLSAPPEPVVVTVPLSRFVGEPCCGPCVECAEYAASKRIHDGPKTFCTVINGWAENTGGGCRSWTPKEGA